MTAKSVNGSSPASADASPSSSQQPAPAVSVEETEAVVVGDEELDQMMASKVSFEPEVVQFLLQLYDKVYLRCMDSLRRLYDTDYPNISDKFFAHSPWPAVEEVSDFYKQCQRYHCLIIALYSELYYRHLHMKCADKVTWEDRRKSWENYAILVEFLGQTTAQQEGEYFRLPALWLYDIFDEFFYQFQDACVARQRRWRALASEAQQGGDPRAGLTEMGSEVEIWPATTVFFLLHRVVQQSELKKILENPQEGGRLLDTEQRYQIGYFALIQQFRLHVQVGAFYFAISCIEDLEISPRALDSRVPSAQMTLVYLLGFSYMMVRRYHDAMRVMSQALATASRQKGQVLSSRHQLITSKCIDRMHVLLLLCSTLSAARLEDSIHQAIKEKFPEKFYKLQQDSDEAYCEVFTWASPRFIDPTMVEDPESLIKYAASGEFRLRILRLFLKEVECRRRVNTVNSFAKLYSNIPISKLGDLMEVKGSDTEETVRADLMAAKRQAQQRVWKQGSLLSGEVQTATPDGTVEFKIEGDMVHVKNQQTQRVYVEYFLRHVEKTHALEQTLNQTALPPPVPIQQLVQQLQQNNGVQPRGPAPSPGPARTSQSATAAVTRSGVRSLA